MATTIAGEISRLNAAKREIKRSIEAKGIRVDPNARIDRYPQFINRISGVALESLSVTENGTYTSPSNTAYNEVTVNVSAPAPTVNLQDKTATANGSYTADAGYDGLGTVTVNVTPTLENKTITTNGTYTAGQGYDGLGTVTVNVSGGGSQESSVTVYYLMNSRLFYSDWDLSAVFYDANWLNNIQDMYVDGQRVTPSQRVDLKSKMGITQIKFVLDPNNNTVPDSNFALETVCYIDWSKYTGTYMPQCGGQNSIQCIPDGIVTVNECPFGPYGSPSNVYIPASVERNNGSRFGIRTYFAPGNNTWYCDQDGGIIFNKSNDSLYTITGNSVKIPEGYTTVIKDMFNFDCTGTVLPASMTDFESFYYANEYWWFLNPVPPRLVAGSSDMDSSDYISIVPAGSETDYYNLYNTAGFTNALRHIAPISEINAYMVYDHTVSDNQMFFRWDGDRWRIGKIEIYDSNDNLIHTVAGNEYGGGLYGNSSNIFTSGDGIYKIRVLYTQYQRESWEGILNYMFAHSELSITDVEAYNYGPIGENWFSGCTGLEKIKLGDGITSIGNGFCNDSPNLTDIVMTTVTPPTIDANSCFNNISQAVTVQLPDNNTLAAYEADVNWASLQQQGKISMTV